MNGFIHSVWHIKEDNGFNRVNSLYYIWDVGFHVIWFCPGTLQICLCSLFTCSLDTAFQWPMDPESSSGAFPGLLPGHSRAVRHFGVYNSEESDLCSEKDAFNTRHCPRLSNPRPLGCPTSVTGRKSGKRLSFRAGRRVRVRRVAARCPQTAHASTEEWTRASCSFES